MGRAENVHPSSTGIHDEWTSTRGNVRCRRIKSNGKRCKHWAALGYNHCCFHNGPRASKKNMGYAFKTERAKDAFERAVNNPEYHSVREELALIRACVQMFIQHAESCAEQGKLKPKHVAFMAQMAQDAAKVAEQCSRIERGLSLHVSVEALDAFLGQLIGVVVRVVKDDDLVAKISQQIADLELPTGGARSARMRQAAETLDKGTDDGARELDEEGDVDDPREESDGDDTDDLEDEVDDMDDD